jgi:hypothetical protein
VITPGLLRRNLLKKNRKDFCRDLVLISITEIVGEKKGNVQVSGVVSRYSIIKGDRPSLNHNKSKTKENDCRKKKKEIK